MFVSILRQGGWSVCARPLLFGYVLCLQGEGGWVIDANGLMIGLNATFTEDGGVWRIRKREKMPVIEVFKVEERGYGDILSKEFVEWRCQPEQVIE